MNQRRRTTDAAIFVFVALGCSRPGAANPGPGGVTAIGPASPPSAAAVVAAPPAASSVAATAQPASCGELGCRLYESPERAFATVLDAHPVVLGIGEAHAQKGSEGIASTTRRFTETLLPLLQGRASDLIVELWLPDPRCLKKANKIAERQKVVTEKQAASNQDEYVVLGKRAEAIGIKPHALRPSCEEYDLITGAGGGDVSVMLRLIAEHTTQQAKSLLARNAEGGARDALVVAYGGALHNDLQPRAGREAWSFGPELNSATQGRYVELDLIVPELVKDSEVWRALDWYAHFDPNKNPDKTTLYNPHPGSYVLIFPRSSSAAPDQARP